MAYVFLKVIFIKSIRMFVQIVVLVQTLVRPEQFTLQNDMKLK